MGKKKDKKEKKTKLKSNLEELRAIAKLFDPEAVVTAPEAEKAAPRQLSEKEAATARGEPYVNIIGMDFDADTLMSGSFELDWNDLFVVRLIKAGYQGKDDSDIVEQWFQAVCRNIVMETWEQAEAQERPARYTQEKQLTDGRKEIS